MCLFSQEPCTVADPVFEAVLDQEGELVGSEELRDRGLGALFLVVVIFFVFKNLLVCWYERDLRHDYSEHALLLEFEVCHGRLDLRGSTLDLRDFWIRNITDDLFHIELQSISREFTFLPSKRILKVLQHKLDQIFRP